MSGKRVELLPQAGFQTAFLSSAADICIGGGSAGGGKSYALLLEAARNTEVNGFDAMLFRRTSPQLKMPGGLWDKSLQLYKTIGGQERVSELNWTFRSGAKITMRPLEYEADVYDHQGGEYAFIGFDELPHFTRKQFFYLLSRNRSTCGVRPYVRGTCNPDPDSWVAEFLSWWIDQETGLPIPERCGVLRYMVTIGDNIIWADSKQEAIEKVPSDFWDNNPAIQSGDLKREDFVKSVTFIPGCIYENKELLMRDPGYLGNLMAQSEEDQLRLLGGNWKIRSDGNGIFDESAINDLFSNNVPDEKDKYITCDAARFGRDLMVIMVWIGWRVVKIIIAKKSDERMIVDAIEKQRRQWNVMKSNVLIDQDGVGGGALALGGYKGFSGGGRPLEEKAGHVIENYKNLKTQCYYRIADRINVGSVQILCTSESCITIEESKKVSGEAREIRGLEIMIGSKTYYIPELIKKQLRVIKKIKSDMDGKKQINDKSDQKLSLGGMSPDFADTIMMREYFALKPSYNQISQYAGIFR